MRTLGATRTIGVLRGACGAAALFGALVVCVPVACAASEPEPFGVTRFTMETTERTSETLLGEEQGGQKAYEFVNVPYAFTQAGGHPWALTTTAELTSEEISENQGGTSRAPTRDPKDLVTTLPVGLIGDPMAVPRCPLADIGNDIKCPADTQIGVGALFLGKHQDLGPIVDVTPEAGQSAEFAIQVAEVQQSALDGASGAYRTGLSFHGREQRVSRFSVDMVRIDVLGCAGRPEPRSGTRTHLQTGRARVSVVLSFGGGETSVARRWCRF